MNNIYNIYEVNISWDDYDTHFVLVGAKDEKDLLEHIDDIFEPYYMVIDGFDEFNNPIYVDIDKYEEGCLIEKYFTEEELKDLSDIGEPWSRIKPIKHMFTDTPYTILNTFGHCE